MAACDHTRVSGAKPRQAPGADRSNKRAERTRARLLRAARELIADNGVSALRIADITETADVGRGSFYNHFGTKEALVESVIVESLETLAAGVLAELPQDSDPAVVASWADRRFIRLAYDDPDFARLLVNLAHGDELFAAATIPYARAAIDRGLRTGRFTVTDEEVTLIQLAGGALAVIRAILAGRLGAGADSSHAEAILRLLGVDHMEAHAISRLPLRAPFSDLTTPGEPDNP